MDRADEKPRCGGVERVVIHERVGMSIDAPAGQKGSGTVCVSSYEVRGLVPMRVEVNVEVRAGLPSFTVVGVPEVSVAEMRERVRGALLAEGFTIPDQRIIVHVSNLGARRLMAHLYDLPAALGILAASGQLDPALLEHLVVVGELGLRGKIRPVAGVFVMAEHSGDGGYRGMVVPAENENEARAAGAFGVIGASTLGAVVKALEWDLEAVSTPHVSSFVQPDMSEIVGLATARRAMEIAAAGGHSLCFVGETGAGATMLARRMPGVMPPLSDEEARDTSAVQSVAGTLDKEAGIATTRPFRAPHHTISAVGLTGGGRNGRPGELSLAHHGVLFLDDVLAFSPSVLDVVPGAAQRGYIDVSRALETWRFPAHALVLGKAQRCPCGRRGDEPNPCVCPEPRKARYQQIFDRVCESMFDMVISLEREPLADREETRVGGESSAEIRTRVEQAHAFRRARLDRVTEGQSVGDEEDASMDGAARTLLRRAVDRRGLSQKGSERMVRVARTIADLAGSEEVSAEHVAEALSYRPGFGVQG